MPAKHSARPLGPARIFLSAAAAVLVMLVVWVAVRAVGPAEATLQPKVVLPSMPKVPIATSFSAAPPTPAPTSSSASRTPSASRSASPSRSSARPKATSHSPAAPSPTPSKTPPKPIFSVTVSVPASWEQGYVAAVRVQNTSRSAQSWSVTVGNSGLDNVRLLGTWNARGSQNGSNLTFTGGPLAPGASLTFGYQISKTGHGNARPSGCSVVGGECAVS